MNTTVLNSIIARLIAQRDLKQQELDALDAEIATMKALLTPAPQATPEPQPQAEPVAVETKPAARVGQPVPVDALVVDSRVQVRAPRQDPDEARLMALIDSLDLVPEVPMMEPETMVRCAALRRTEMTGAPTMLSYGDKGLATICCAYMRGALPGFMSTLRELRVAYGYSRQRLQARLNAKADNALAQVYPWLSGNQRFPLTQEARDEIQAEVMRLAKELSDAHEARIRAGSDAHEGPMQAALRSAEPSISREATATA